MGARGLEAGEPGWGSVTGSGVVWTQQTEKVGPRAKGPSGGFHQPLLQVRGWGQPHQPPRGLSVNKEGYQPLGGVPVCPRDPGGGGTVPASELSRCRRQVSPAGSAHLPWQGQGWGEGSQEAGMAFHRYKLFHDASPHFPSPQMVPSPPSSNSSAQRVRKSHTPPSRHFPNPSKSPHGPHSVRPTCSAPHLSLLLGVPPHLGRPPAYPGCPGLCTCQGALEVINIV